ncbi:MAG: hypothetical protein M1840_000456 [Geoglossum simile]|nr:MAG: hypothetical protein M1840_000456 [Geoglossum simile]
MPPAANLISVSQDDDVRDSAREAAMHLALAYHARYEYSGNSNPSPEDWRQNPEELFFETFVVHATCDNPRISFSAACIAESYLGALRSGDPSSSGDYDSDLKVRRTGYYDLSNQKDLEDVGEIFCRITAAVQNHP